ncbi:AAA family ATPase [Teredinibacter sp. KSP-S5-2]|uniref:AAA family ATPase n=1 Tax=Teredinibacter sp. KSP-S5-2 TaxID=3034506 RepID=UPI00293438B8|nr:AAA family ATPase [Teredinibacter sp. KSP-S5-2]WNO07949.1 AAA family ATPase [Teredinibacter sp. KSP-S5-2]
MSKPKLYIFSGLPGVGKSTLAQELARITHAFYLRIDTIEQALRDLCNYSVEGEGYRLAYRIASDNLRLGKSVIADSCNPITLTRGEWNDVAINSSADSVNIEIICSDKMEHRQRVELRQSTVPNLKLSTWDEIENREYHQWNCDRFIIDTAGKSVLDCVMEIQKHIS